MPYLIVHKDDKFEVHKENEDKTPGELLHTYDNEKEAEQYLKALYANVPDTGKSIPPIEKAVSPVEGLVEVGSSHFTIEEIKDFVKRQFQENVGGGVDRDKLPDSSFVFSDERIFPIVIAKDVGDAVHSFGRYKGKHSFEEFKTRLSSLAKRKGFESSLPEKWDEPSKSLNLDYVKSVSGALVIPDMAAKYVARDLIRHPIFVWGNPQQLDVEREYFDKNTDLWDKYYVDIKRPLTWDHAQDMEFKDESPIVGQTIEYEDDDVARWAVSRLERNRKYRKAIDKLIEEGALGSSSDSVPQYVLRQKSIDGKSYLKSGTTDWVCEEDGTSVKSIKPSATYLKRWPWVASALTDVPCEPRMNGSVEWFKSLGVQIPDVRNLEREVMELKARYFKLFT